LTVGIYLSDRPNALQVCFPAQSPFRNPENHLFERRTFPAQESCPQLLAGARLCIEFSKLAALEGRNLMRLDRTVQPSLDSQLQCSAITGLAEADIRSDLLAY
jgi:hypothetical protein